MSGALGAAADEVLLATTHPAFVVQAVGVQELNFHFRENHWCLPSCSYLDADERRPSLEAMMDDYWRLMPSYQACFSRLPTGQGSPRSHRRAC